MASPALTLSEAVGPRCGPILGREIASAADPLPAVAVADTARELLRGLAEPLPRCRPQHQRSRSGLQRIPRPGAARPGDARRRSLPGWVGSRARRASRTRSSSLAPEQVREFILDLLVDSESRLGGQQGWLILGSVLLAVLLGFAGRGGAAAGAGARGTAHRTTARRAECDSSPLRSPSAAGWPAGDLFPPDRREGHDRLPGGAHRASVSSTRCGRGCGCRSRRRASTCSCWPSTAGDRLSRWRSPGWRHWSGPLGALGASLAFGLYLNLAPELGATFGVLGAVALALVWLYLGAFAILLGAVVVAYTLRWRSARNGSG